MGVGLEAAGLLRARPLPHLSGPGLFVGLWDHLYPHRRYRVPIALQLELEVSAGANAGAGPRVIVEPREFVLVERKPLLPDGGAHVVQPGVPGLLFLAAGSYQRISLPVMVYRFGFSTTGDDKGFEVLVADCASTTPVEEHAPGLGSFRLPLTPRQFPQRTAPTHCGPHFALRGAAGPRDLVGRDRGAGRSPRVGEGFLALPRYQVRTLPPSRQQR